MNSIAKQIDYATQEFAALNRLLEARSKLRQLDDARINTVRGTSDRHIANLKYTDMLAHVMRLERDYEDMFGPDFV